MTAHLITRADGKKFGKSEDGALFLDPKLTSPYKLYQYFINCTDEDAVKYLKVFTFLSHDEIEAVAKDHFDHPGMASLVDSMKAKFGQTETKSATTAFDFVSQSPLMKDIYDGHYEKVLTELKKITIDDNSVRTFS